MSNDPMVWKDKANDYLKNGDYKSAIMLYDRAIRLNPELPVLYLNKSLACLRDEAFFMAYETARIALEKGGDREKSMHR